jgi:UDP-N-acetylglucosamine acyltransferase
VSAPKIHPHAVVDPGARIADDAEIGPFCTVGADAKIGAGTRLISHVVIEGRVTLGEGNILHPFTAIGFYPQDFKFKGDPTEVVIGDRNIFRENCTIHRGTRHGGGVTRIGSDGFFMVGSHVAHDGQLGDHVLFANAGTLAGHVEVGDHAVVGAFSGVHQFCRVGPYAYVGGYSVVTRDALPYCLTVGNRARCYGINRVGLRRMGLNREVVEALDQATRGLFRPGPTRAEALAEVEARWGSVPEVKRVVDFVRGSRRGVTPIRLDAAWEGDE